MEKDNFDIDRELLIHQMGIETADLPEEGTAKEDKTADTEETAKVKKKASDSKIDFYDLVQCVVSAVVFSIIIFVFLFRVIGVKGNSMFSTLHNGDKVIVSGLFYTPEQGDIVILKTDMYDQPLVKRVIATEFQTLDIDFKNGIVYVDGEALDEPYTYEKTFVDEGFKGPVTVPEGCVFVMGDNRNDSNDSRLSKIGFIDERAIFGKVYWMISPGADANGYDWSRVGLIY